LQIVDRHEQRSLIGERSQQGEEPGGDRAIGPMGATGWRAQEGDIERLPLGRRKRVPGGGGHRTEQVGHRGEGELRLGFCGPADEHPRMCRAGAVNCIAQHRRLADARLTLDGQRRELVLRTSEEPLDL